MCIKFCQSLLADLLKKRLRQRCIPVNLAKFFKKPIFQNTCKWLVLDFALFYMSHSIIYLIKRKGKKTNYYFFECIQQDFNIGEISPKEIIRFENATFQESSTWNHSLGHGSRWNDELRLPTFKTPPVIIQQWIRTPPVLILRLNKTPSVN